MKTYDTYNVAEIVEHLRKATKLDVDRDTVMTWVRTLGEPTDYCTCDSEMWQNWRVDGHNIDLYLDTATEAITLSFDNVELKP